MNWNTNLAIHVGRDHEFKKVNLQDYVTVQEDDKAIIGVICDGCSEGKHSEVGASLIGIFIARLLSILTHRNLAFNDKELLKRIIEDELLLFFKKSLDTVKLSMALNPVESVNFIKNYFLTTLVFCVILKEEKKIIIGNSGDGVVVKNYDVFKKYQNDKPHYLAYQVIPKHYLEKLPSEIESLNIDIFSDGEMLHKVIISSDGLEPFIEKHSVEELYGKKGRQLQRLINKIQNTEKIFFDDISLITFENDTSFKEVIK